jgi:hypothetical protein
LASWAVSQLKYSDILTKVEPMKQLIAKLEEEGSKLETQANELTNTIDQL